MAMLVQTQSNGQTMHSKVMVGDWNWSLGSIVQFTLYCTVFCIILLMESHS